MRKFLGLNKLRVTLGAAGAIVVGLSPVATLAQQRFSFNAVEYLPRDQRLAAAQAFVAANAAPGTPIHTAEAAIRRAGAYCHGGKAKDDVISCSLTSVVAHSDENSQNEVVWQVQITPDSEGAVAAASVRRTLVGF